MLAKVIRIYFASARANDFSGANNYYDLWLYDEFHQPDQKSHLISATQEGTTYANTLLKVLDGQVCRLDSKYQQTFRKHRKVPVIMIANELPGIMEKHGPFRARFIRLPFYTKIQNLEEGRIIATLLGCIDRRIQQSLLAYLNPTPTHLNLEYNDEQAYLLLHKEPHMGKGVCCTRNLQYYEVTKLFEKEPCREMSLEANPFFAPFEETENVLLGGNPQQSAHHALFFPQRIRRSPTLLEKKQGAQDDAHRLCSHTPKKGRGATKRRGGLLILPRSIQVRADPV